MKRLLTLLCTTIVISGCAVSPSMNFPIEPSQDELSKFEYGEKPVQYKKLIEDYISSELIDPESARFTRFSVPKKDWLGDGEIGGKTYIGWLVCVDVNAKNRMGGYTGRKMHSLILKDNKILFAQSDVTTKTTANGWGAPHEYPIVCNYDE